MMRCLQSFGFNFQQHTYTAIFNAVDIDCSGSIGFDEFVQVLAECNSLTAVFRQHDPTSCGRAQIDYATFIHMVFSTRS